MMRTMVSPKRRAQFALEVPTAIGRASSAALQQISDMTLDKFEAKDWQNEAAMHTRFIGELGYVVNLKADTVAAGEIKVRERDLDTGRIIEPERDDDGNEIIDADREKAERVLNALRGPYGGVDAILHSFTIADEVAGEGFLLGEPVEDTNQISWEMVSIMEIEVDRDKNVKRNKHAGKRSSMQSSEGDHATLHPDTYIARYHRPDWMHSGDPTSPLRRVASSCRELTLLTQLVEATIRSNIPAGMLYVPEEMDFPTGDDDDGLDDEESVNGLMQVLSRHMSAPVEDRSSLAALVPLLVSGPGEFADKIKLISLKDTDIDLAWAISTRNDSLARLATGLDIPPETLSGKGQLSHWMGANVDIDFIKKHTIPTGDRAARFLTTSFFRRALVEYEGMQEDAAERFELEYDASALITRSDSAESADKLWADRLISDDARTIARGFDPDQVRAKEEERDRRLIETAYLANPAQNAGLLGALISRERLVNMGVEAETADNILSGPKAAAEPEAAPDQSGPAERPSQRNEDPTGGEAPTESLALVIERIRTAGDAALERGLEKAANTVIGKLPKDSHVTKDQIRSVPRINVLSRISPADMKAMRLTPEKLMSRAWDEFTVKAVMWMRESLETDGVDPTTADERARRIISDFTLHLDQRALSAFKTPIQRDRGMLVHPEPLITAVLES